MAHTDITLTVRNVELDLTVEGHISTGGSNSYGSDEPAWCEVEDMDVYSSCGKALSPRLRKHIIDNHYDYIMTRLIESK